VAFFEGGFNNEMQRVGGLMQTAVGWGGCLGRAWVKRSGLRAYQSRINAILRREMLTAMRAAAAK
jgi:hypothetical protein